MSAELFTVATHATQGSQRFQGSLSKFSVPATVLGQNEPEFWGYGWRWKTFARAARQSAADIVIHCDAFDSVCIGSLNDLIANFAALQQPIVFGYAPQEQPEPWLGLDAGLMIAERQAFASIFDDAMLDQLFPDHFNDQLQLQSLYSWKPAAFALDKQSELFHTFGSNSPGLVSQNNKLINPNTGKSPSFVHAPRGGNLSSVEAWLAAV